MAPENLTEGNTKPQSKRQSAGKKFIFVWNNYDKDWMALLAPVFESRDIKWKVGKEVGENGTPHLQGYIESETKIRPIEAFKLPKQIHWEVARGNRRQNIKYVCKDGDYHGNLPDIYVPECKEPFGWALKVPEILNEPICPRTIHWFWEPWGNVGKSDIVRWLVVRHNAMICAGKATDMKFQIANHFAKTGEVTRNVVFDIPRSMENYISYSGMEEIKNGVFSSPKFESCTYVGPRPRVFVFANFKPEPGIEMSKDRFKIFRIVVEREEGEIRVSQTFCDNANMLQNMPYD